MILGLRQGDIKLVEHQADWKDEFTKIQGEIMEATGIQVERIEHVGSTSIPHMKAKPMVDFALGVNDFEAVPKVLFKQLQEIGFLRLRVVLENEIVLAKFTDDTYQVKTHIIHLTDYQGEKWNELLTFRNALRSSATLREEYEQVKLDFIENETGTMDDYTHYKEAFIMGVLKEATHK